MRANYKKMYLDLRDKSYTVIDDLRALSMEDKSKYEKGWQISQEWLALIDKQECLYWRHEYTQAEYNASHNTQGD